MSDDLVERVARRLCNTAGSNWHAENFNQTDDGSDPEDQREYYRMLGRAAIAVVLEEAAKVAEGEAVTAAGDEYQSDKPGHFWHRESIYGTGRSDAATAIRALMKKPTDPGPASGSGF